MADKIKEMLALEDNEILNKFGFDKKVDKFKADLAEADQLSGDARKKINESLERAFQPSSYVLEDIGWQVQHAKDKAEGKCTPATLVEDCGCSGD